VSRIKKKKKTVCETISRYTVWSNSIATNSTARLRGRTSDYGIRWTPQELYFLNTPTSYLLGGVFCSTSKNSHKFWKNTYLRIIVIALIRYSWYNVTVRVASVNHKSNFRKQFTRNRVVLCKIVFGCYALSCTGEVQNFQRS